MFLYCCLRPFIEIKGLFSKIRSWILRYGIVEFPNAKYQGDTNFDGRSKVEFCRCAPQKVLMRNIDFTEKCLAGLKR